MRFFGGLLKILSVFLMLGNTVGWTIAAVVEIKDYGMSEYIWVFVLLWLAIMFVLLGMLGAGIALTQSAKLKKRVQQLEQQGIPVRQYIAANPFPVEVPQKAVEIPQTPTEISQMPEETVIEAKVTAAPVQETKQEKAKSRKKWPLIAIAVILVAAVIAVVLFAGRKDQPEAAGIAPAVEQQVADNGEVPQQQEALREEDVQDDAIPVSLGGCIDNENFTMTFTSMEMMDEFSYRTSEYSTTSLFVEEGYKVLVVQGHFTNNSTSTISDSAFNLKATVNDAYTADGFDVRISFIRNKSFEVDPYTDVDYVLYVNVPEKLAAEFETATFTIGWKNDMSIPVTVWNVDGTQTVELDNRYALTSGIVSAEEAAAAAAAGETLEEYNWISIGETVYTTDYEFTLRNVEMTYEVLPPNTSSVYTSYAAESGKVFVHVEADVKNTMQRDIRIDEIFTAGAYYDWKYPYDGFTIVNDGDDRFDWVGSYVAATPLETCRAHSLIECPVEVDTSGNSVVVNIQIGEETYYYTLR